MVTFTNSGIKDVYIEGPTKTYIAGGRIPFGAAVIRAGAGTVKAAILENSMYVIGIADSDELEHKYDGFYESGDPVRVCLGGCKVNGLVATVGATNLLQGDYLSVIDITSTTNTFEYGVLGESATTAGEARVVASVAKVLEDVTLGSATYAAPASTPVAGEYTIVMTTGGPTTMGVQVGDYILIRDSDGTGAAQVNKLTAITDVLFTVEVPITVAAADLIHAIRQAEMLVIT